MQRQPTEAERERRRAEDRKRLEGAVRELQTSGGWQRWVAVRRHNGLSRYSLNNQLLISVACWRRGITPTYVAGYRWWSENGYQVRKGEKALRILGPVRRKVADKSSGEQRLAVVGFRGLSVFERSQVDAGPDATPLEPMADGVIDGASHGRCLAPITEALEVHGVKVEFGPVQIAGARGYYDPSQRLIRVERALEPNAKLRVLLHEGAHALFATEQGGKSAERDAPPRLSYAEEECVVETAGHVAASALGLDTSSEAVPYVAGWGEAGALDAVERAAELVDRIAGWLEVAATAIDDQGEELAAA